MKKKFRKMARTAKKKSLLAESRGLDIPQMVEDGK